MDLIIRVTRVTNLGWGDAFLQALSATARRKHKTLSLMGATRLASGIFQQSRHETAEKHFDAKHINRC